jgi:protein phosphatase-4 regulatory subunit 3
MQLSHIVCRLILAAVQHMQQRESLANYISQNDCSYLKSLLSLFPSAEDKGDYRSLATLAACVKTILLLNDPSIIELIVTDELIFEDVCSTLEYDPDLRDKANHRWYLRERAKFRTVALMQDEELIAAIHRSFRVNYLRDTLLRPTMDESSLSTLSSLQTFTHADVVKGVTMSPTESEDNGELLKDSYLAKIIRILGRESDAICEVEWKELENLPAGTDVHALLAKRREEANPDPSMIVSSGKYPQNQKLSTIWKQHLAPQDASMSSRRLRRRGSLSFLRELFNMVRVSLQQNDKDDFFAVLVSMKVDLSYDQENRVLLESSTGNVKEKVKSKELDTLNNSNSPPVSSKPVNLLSLLANILSDPETDVTEKSSVLEIISGIAMHDPSLIRRRCIEFYSTWNRRDPNGGQIGPVKPLHNVKSQVLFQCPPGDLLASLLFLMATESDAGVLLQASEIMRIILDTDMMGDHGPLNTGFADEAEGIPPTSGLNPPHDQHSNPTGTGNTTSTEQNKFLHIFYEHYVQWLAVPFQSTIIYPLLRVPRSLFFKKEKTSPLIESVKYKFHQGLYQEEPLLYNVPFSALRSSFAVELLSFCVRAHVYRMKTFLMRSTASVKILRLLWPSALPRNTSGDRCLKLAALRFLRAIISVNDDAYHRHIIQNDLFEPVFQAFRANPVGDNLVSSSIVEMCDYINKENIMSLIEYIATRHLSASGTETPLPSLEDVSSPYVNTLTCLRQAYEKNLCSNFGHVARKPEAQSNGEGNGHTVTNEKALEDQRKFREADQEESYFESDD